MSKFEMASKLQDAFHYMLFARADYGCQIAYCAFEGSREYSHSVAGRRELAVKAVQLARACGMEMNMPPRIGANIDAFADNAARAIRDFGAAHGVDAPKGCLAGEA